MTPARWLTIAAAVCLALLWALAPDGAFLAALGLLLVCPGFLLERWLLRDMPLAPPARVTVWIGLSISAVALVYQWATALGLSVTDTAAGALACGLALAGALVAWRSGAAGQTSGGRRFSLARASAPGSMWAAVLLLILALTLWTRFEHIRGLAAPAWVDSVHHALLIRVAAERGQAPYDLAPYLRVSNLTYHSGYHVFLASALDVCGALQLPRLQEGERGPGALGPCATPLPSAMLLSGQVLNALVALAWMGAASYLWRRPAAVAAAGVVVGLVSIMPAFYVSWGRYTLVTGMAMLPAAIVVCCAAARAERAARPEGWRAVAAAGVLLAGLSLVHFVVLCLALLWCAAWLLVAWAPVRPVARLGAAGVLALALTAPWTALLLAEARFSTGSSAVHVAGNDWYNAMPEALLWASNNRLLLALAGAGALLALRHNRRTAVAVLVWAALAALLANPVVLGLPYLSFFTNEFLAITLFAPVSMLIAGGAAVLDARLHRFADAVPRGHAAGQVSAGAGHRRSRAAAARSALRHLSGAALLALAVWSASQFRSVVRPDTILATEADLRAIAWAARELPAEARFVVNTAGWLGDVDRGADGGWWLLPLAARQVSTPPVVFNYGEAGYAQAVKEETTWLRSGAGADPDALADFMRQRGYEYVYASGRGASFDAARLQESPHFAELHRDSDVTIFRLVP